MPGAIGIESMPWHTTTPSINFNSSYPVPVHKNVARIQRSGMPPGFKVDNLTQTSTMTPSLESPTPSQFGEERSEDESDEFSEDVDFKDLIKR